MTAPAGAEVFLRPWSGVSARNIGPAEKQTMTPRQHLFALLHERIAIGDDCWLWTGQTNELGYGLLTIDNRPYRAHRLVYEFLVGPIPEGLVLDHLCRVPGCVNPSHLEPVTQAENVLRGVGFSGTNARKTRCDSGHPFDKANTYITPDGWRKCRRCRSLGMSAKKRAEREATT